MENNINKHNDGSFKRPQKRKTMSTELEFTAVFIFLH